jgi:DNA-binding MarR family transcriptional regulator
MVIFGEWLKQRHCNHLDFITDNADVNEAGTDSKVSYLMLKTMAYAEIWGKVSFNDVPIQSFGDYAILKIVFELKNPSKKQISKLVLMEPTTCIESIKRLMKNGLLKEEKDEDDKRIRRVSLTDQGHELLIKLDNKLQNISSLLMGDLTEPEKLSLIPILKKLSSYHQNIYSSFEKPEIKRIFKI